jgi:hypothetical protein
MKFGGNVIEIWLDLNFLKIVLVGQTSVNTHALSNACKAIHIEDEVRSHKLCLLCFVIILLD